MNAMTRNAPMLGLVPVENWQLRTLLRIVTENRDPNWILPPWVAILADQCGLNLADPEGVKARWIK